MSPFRFCGSSHSNLTVFGAMVWRSHRYHINDWNAAHETASDLDEEVVDGIHFAPEEFHDEKSDWVLGMSFLELEAPAGTGLSIRVTAEDALGESATVSTDATP